MTEKERKIDIKIEKNNFQKNIFKFLIFSIFIILMVIIILNLWPVFKNIATEEGRLLFKEHISNIGILGPLTIILLMFAQIIFAFLPGEPVQLLAGMCYGPILGTLYLTLGSFLSSLSCYLLVRKYGIKLLYFLFDEKKVHKVLDNKIFSKKKSINLILFLGFFIPAFPKDLLVYIAGLLPTNLFSFLIISTVGRLPSIFVATLCGAGIANGNFGIIFTSYAVLFLLTFLIIFLNKDTAKQLKD